MKILRLLVIPLTLAAIVLLASCDVYIYSDIGAFRLERAEYRSYSYNGSSVFCDDRTTPLVLVLDYQGEIEYVNVDLVGERYDGRRSLSSFSPSTTENERGLIQRSFDVRRGVSPLATTVSPSEGTYILRAGEQLSGQSIVVVPVNPTIIGYTSIEVRVETTNEVITLTSPGIPVLDYCD